MPIPFDDYGDKLEPGDVLMVTRRMLDRKTRKPYDWKFFLVVTQHRSRYSSIVKGMIIGATNERWKDEPVTVLTEDCDTQYLPPDEWPEGVHAFRMAMVLKGLIPDIV